MKILVNIEAKEVELEGNAAQIQTALDIIQERFVTFAPLISKRKVLSSAELFKQMMEELSS